MAAPAFSLHPSRRPVIYGTHGVVACTQPLAAQAGLSILRKGGNAADAAVAAAAVLNVTEPTSTGIGGDVFALYHNASTSTLHSINGTGRSPANLTLAAVLAGAKTQPPIHSVTVPGAAAAWCDLVTRHGSGALTMREILNDAIELAEGGFPVSTFAARWWGECEPRLGGSGRGELLRSDGRAPVEGEVVRLKELAGVFRALAEGGKEGFYGGWVGEAIVREVQSVGGVLDGEDLGRMAREQLGERPVAVRYGRYRLWEGGPNGQGVVALMALGILRILQERGVLGRIGGVGGIGHNEPEYLHALIEVFRIVFADGRWYITDPSTNPDPTASLLSDSYLHSRSTLFSPTSIHPPHTPGKPFAHLSSDTTYLSTTDSHGNGCSLVNSLKAGFGSGLVPAGTGIVLQNRGESFSLDPESPNVFAPGKRPFTTIIAGMVTEERPGGGEGEKGGEAGEEGVKLTKDRIKCVFGCMGGLMQPQGHVQLFMNLFVFGMNPQEALDAPRICLGTPGDRFNIDGGVCCEEGIPERTLEALRERGHNPYTVSGYERVMFGRGQVINYNYTTDADADGGERIVYSAGTDLRGDCQAVGY